MKTKLFFRLDSVYIIYQVDNSNIININETEGERRFNRVMYQSLPTILSSSLLRSKIWMFYDNTIAPSFSTRHLSSYNIPSYLFLFLHVLKIEVNCETTTEKLRNDTTHVDCLVVACNTYMSSARARVTRVKASVRIQREVKMRELAREVRDSERMDERRPPPPAHRPSATQPILCHLKQKSSILVASQMKKSQTMLRLLVCICVCVWIVPLLFSQTSSFRQRKRGLKEISGTLESG